LLWQKGGIVFWTNSSLCSLMSVLSCSLFGVTPLGMKILYTDGKSNTVLGWWWPVIEQQLSLLRQNCKLLSTKLCTNIKWQSKVQDARSELF